MKVAVMSDSHDNIWNLEKALKKAQSAEALVFCGDLCAPFSLKMLADGFAGPIHALRGNNDGDVALLLRVAGQSGHVRFYTESLAELELGGRKSQSHITPIWGMLLRFRASTMLSFSATPIGRSSVGKARRCF